MQESALRSVFIFQKRGIGLDNYKGKESLSRVVVILEQGYQEVTVIGLVKRVIVYGIQTLML